MKQIKILKDFGINDVSDDDEIIPILDKLNIDGSTEVELDITGCLIDYPATSKIIDKIISQLKVLSGQKKFKILMDYNLPKVTLINWLFLGSCELNMAEKKELPLNDIKSTILECLEPSEINLVITIKDNTGELIDEFSFDKL